MDAKTDSTPGADTTTSTPTKKPHRWRRRFLIAFFILIGLFVIAHIALAPIARWYVNSVIDQSPMYDGSVGKVEINLWRGAYAIHDIKLIQTTGNVPVPLLVAKTIGMSVEWKALLRGHFVGKVEIDQPEINFVDAEDDSSEQTGVGGPWLEMLRQLAPFRINSAQIHNGSIHFRAYQKDEPIDVYLSQLEASVENLSNIHDDITPLFSTITAKGMAMDQADFEFQMRFDPFSYRPTFEVAMRLLGLDVTKMNQLARGYGGFDFEHGYFDLVVEMDAKEGGLEGYVKPLFREMRILSLKNDIPEDNILQVFWEALVGTATGLLTNQPREQFGTRIPFTGDLTAPQTDIIATVGAVLRNAFVRAYLPRREQAESAAGITFGPGEITDPISIGD